MRVALYARCSTRDQTLDIQLDGLRDYAEARDFEMVGEYLDEGISGAKARRPELDRLLADAHRRRFDAVLVWKLDRLGRSLSHVIRLVEELGSLGVDLVSVGDPGLDTTSPHGKLIFSIMGAVAEFERDLIKERVTAGVKAARRRGVRFGRPHALDAQQTARVERLRAAGHSVRAIAEIIGVSKSVVAREVSQNSSVVEVATPAPSP